MAIELKTVTKDGREIGQDRIYHGGLKREYGLGKVVVGKVEKYDAAEIKAWPDGKAVVIVWQKESAFLGGFRNRLPKKIFLADEINPQDIVIKTRPSLFARSRRTTVRYFEPSEPQLAEITPLRLVPKI